MAKFAPEAGRVRLAGKSPSEAAAVALTPSVGRSIAVERLGCQTRSPTKVMKVPKRVATMLTRVNESVHFALQLKSHS